MSPAPSRGIPRDIGPNPGCACIERVPSLFETSEVAFPVEGLRRGFFRFVSELALDMQQRGRPRSEWSDPRVISHFALQM